MYILSKVKRACNMIEFRFSVNVNRVSLKSSLFRQNGYTSIKFTIFFASESTCLHANMNDVVLNNIVL